MEHCPHVLLSGSGADAFAASQDVPSADASWFVTAERVAQLERLRSSDPEDAAPDVYGTVGAVARDLAGHLAAATSTGGTVGKTPGRVGDSALIGAGTFAWDATVAVSATGDGEAFIRSHVAGRLSDWVEMAGLSLRESAHRVIHQDLVGGRGGLIAIGRSGPAVMPFNTAGMFRGRMDARGEPEILIW
jgi:beta-aspartyl-peptidase (threonine type)